MAKEDIERFMQAHAVEIKAKFVPLSRSRGAQDERQSLNWEVSLHKDGRCVLITDYGAGAGHCPAYRLKDSLYGENIKRRMVNLECETGFAAVYSTAMDTIRPDKRCPILPDPCDVLYSLAYDSDVIDYRCFEDWAGEFGYDTDSRKAEDIYKECLSIALRLRNGLGEAVLAELREAVSDY